MPTHAHDKYYLKSLHEEIDLFDRKLAHSLRYGTFATEAERKASVGKMNAKRDLLVRTAKLLASEGIEYKESDLPRSFRSDDPNAEISAEAVTTAPADTTDQAEEEMAPAPFARTSSKGMPSPFAGTVLDSSSSMLAYKRSRKKPTAAQA
jgi:hypothetical protein